MEPRAIATDQIVLYLLEKVKKLETKIQQWFNYVLKMVFI